MRMQAWLKGVGPVVASALVLAGLILVGPSASADSWHNYTDGGSKPKREGQPEYSKQATMTKSRGYLQGGGGWDAKIVTRLENENDQVLASASGPGWTTIEVSIPRRVGLYARCHWKSALYSGSDTIGVRCSYYGTAPYARVAAETRQRAIVDRRVARLARSVRLSELADGGIAPERLAWKGRVGRVHYYRGVDRAGKVCLVGLVAGKDAVGTACANAARARSRGLWLGLKVAGVPAETVRLSHGADRVARMSAPRANTR